ncbi:hypothetical protein HPC49_46510, partial [Pyxidicoccus fallax]|nr:hypothetical protein [Pyxidicoccus fallax]
SQPLLGRLDDNGRARINGLPPGPCEVEFPDTDGRDLLTLLATRE